jgi:hypothetical protein
MFNKFVALSYLKGAMHYGYGDSLGDAARRCKKAARSKSLEVYGYRFESDLPFAPQNREANDGESDVWFADDLNLHWKRCKKIDLGRLSD